jgi:GntR family transcriptional regulator
MTQTHLLGGAGAPGADPRLPLHARVKDDLLRRVKANEWAGDAALPPESALAKEYEISVGTVRRVLTELAAEGYLERQQGRGTYIRRASFQHSLFRFFRMHGREGQIPDSRILDRDTVPAEAQVAEALGVAEGTDVLHLLRLRLWEETPFLVEDIWVPLPLFDPLAEVDLAEVGPLLYPAYEQLAGVIIGSATEQLSIEQASPAVAALLDCSLIDPLVRIDRTARTHADEVVEYRRSYGLAKSFQYQVEIN